MEKKRLIVDVSSIAWTCLYAGKDEEFAQKIEHNGKIITVNSWQHGYENAINALLAAWTKNHIQPKDTILVTEAGDSKGLRKQWLSTYKGDRDKDRPAEYYTQFNTLTEKIVTELRALGAAAVCRPGAEADDVIAYLVQKLQGKKIIQTNDGDLAVLLSDDVALWRQGELCTENPYGPWPVKWLPVYKALVGDSSDKIPGAFRFGEKAWLDLICIFGEDGIEAMEGLIQTRQLATLAEDVADLKSLQHVIDSAESVYNSYAAALLYPGECENVRRPLQWGAGYPVLRSEIADERLRPYGGVTRIVHADNYDAAIKFLRDNLPASQWVSLDLETSTSPESDEWLRLLDGGVDVLDSTITSMGLTFGANQNFNLYFTVNHVQEAGVPNITMEQLKAAIETIPATKLKVIQNFAGFEAPVLRLNLGDLNGEHFLPNVVDTSVAASYVNENIRSGLKESTKHYFGVDQTDYATVTQGRKMNQMTAAQTVGYGSDDTIFTSALWNHYERIMEIEGTLECFHKVERDVQYVLAHSFIHGIDFDYGRMKEIEAEDRAEAEAAQRVLNDYLIKIGYEGTVCPVWTAEDLTVPAQIKSIYRHILGRDLSSQVRTPSKLFALISTEDDEDARLLAAYMTQGDLAQLNDWTASRFDGTPALDLGSTKQVKNFLYNVAKLPVRLTNALTDIERAKQPELVEAMRVFSRIQKEEATYDDLTEDQAQLLVKKASADADAIAFALKYDATGNLRVALEAFQKLKEVGTRQSLFYTPYEKLLYWKDRKMHPSVRQSATTTRRFTAGKPNVTQLSKDGEGVKLRSCYVAHKKTAIVCSLDFNAQELRAQADLSNDEAFLACYLGENRLDLHSVTGASIMGVPYEEFLAGLHSEDKATAKRFKDARSDAKPVNFLSAYGGTEFALHRDLVVTLPQAKVFLDAKKRAFPRYEEYQEEMQAMAKSKGYVTDLMGARRHVPDAALADSGYMRNAAARSAGNFPIQSSSAAQTKLAMGALWRSGALLKYDMRFYMPVHDEIVFSVVREQAAEVIELVHRCMTQPFLPRVPSVSSISIGRNYADQHELGESFDAQVLTEKLEQLFEKELQTEQ